MWIKTRPRVQGGLYDCPLVAVPGLALSTIAPALVIEPGAYVVEASEREAVDGRPTRFLGREVQLCSGCLTAGALAIREV